MQMLNNLAAVQQAAHRRKCVLLCMFVLYLIAGLFSNAFAAVQPVGIDGNVYYDVNGDGIENDGGSLPAGITVVVQLFDSSGTTLLATRSSVTTGSTASVAYRFRSSTSLPMEPGNYQVRVVVPSGFAATNTFTPSGSGGAHVNNTTINVAAPTPTVIYRPNDFLITQPVEICGYVYVDNDHDAAISSGDNIYPGPQVVLKGDFNRDGVEDTATAITDANGHYCFTTWTNPDTLLSEPIPPGSYTLIETVPSGYTPVNAFPDAPGVKVTSTRISINASTSGTHYDNQNFLIAPNDFMLSGFVWHDVNANAVRETTPLDPGLNLVTVHLSGTDNDGNPVTATTTTTPDGAFHFENLPAGSYKITVDSSSLPSGLTIETFDGLLNTADGTLDNEVTVTLGDTGKHVQGINFGYTGTGSIGDTLWNDTNGNGIQDNGEPGIEGVSVRLKWIGPNGNTACYPAVTTDANGYYTVTHLPAGDYKVCVNASTLPATFMPTYDLDGIGTANVAMLFLAVAENRTDADFGYQPHNSSLAGTVFCDANSNGIQDSGEPGITNVTVTLKDASGNTITTAITDANGDYNFTQLAPGTYQVTTPQIVEGKAPTTTTKRDVTLGPDEHKGDIDFGYKPGSISGTAFCDTNGNSVQDNGEPGISGVTITLKDANGNVLGTKTTDTNGNYKFEGLNAGSYSVSAPATADGKQLTTTSPLNVTLAAGENKTHVDFGYRVALGCISGYLFCDENGNCVRDNGEEGLACVTVTLKDASGKVIATTVTDKNGFYKFVDLKAGSYVVYAPSTAQGLARITPVQTVNLGGGEKRENVNFAYRGASLCGTAYCDTNRNGCRDRDERGIPGATITLKDWLCRVVATTTTDANGNYSFKCLPAGLYIVCAPTHVGDKTLRTCQYLFVTLCLGEQQCNVNFGYRSNDCQRFTTYTQNGWGSCPNGSNAGTLLARNFDRLYPCDLFIGGCYKIKLTCAQAIANFLPQSGTPKPLTRNYLNPDCAISVFAGQVLALKLNVDFSEAGITRDGLADLRVVSGPLEDWTVGDILILANCVLGGDLNALPDGVSLWSLNEAITRINENFDGGTANRGYLQ